MIPISHDDITLEVPDDESYGLEAFKKMPKEAQLIRELNAYMLTHGKWGSMQRANMGIDLSKTGLKSPLQHMVNCCLILWPEDFLLNVREVRNNYALDVLWALCNQKDIGIAGAASTGKTFSMAAWANIDWMAAPTCTSTYVASTTLDAAEDRLWGKTTFLYRQAMKRCAEMFGPATKLGTLVDYRRMIAYGEVNTKDETRDYTNAIKALAFPKGNEGKKAIETCRGRKNGRVRLLVDELAEMDLYVLDARVNLRSNPDFLFCGAANPAATASNPHTELCQPDDPREWDSVSIHTHCWKTRTGISLHLSGEDSPNFRVLDGSIPYDRYLTHERLAEILELCHGNKNHLEYWRNVYGWWPDSSVELTILTRSYIAQTGLNVEPEWAFRAEKSTVCGFDTGFTAGGDRCAASFFRVGRTNTGKKVGFYLTTKTYSAEVGKVFEESIAEQVVKDCIDAEVAPKDFGMDISGDGGKMLRAIIIEWQKYDASAAHVYPISSMGKPTEKLVSQQDKRKAVDAYDRLVTEYWFNILNAFQSRSLYGIDIALHKALVDEWCSRIYYHKGKKVAVETKAEMKERLKKSPDLGDSGVYGIVMMQRAGVDFSESKEQEDITTKEIRDFEDRVIYRKKEEEEEMFAYAGGSDPEEF